MKPFDLDAARAGAPVCTRAGACARIISFDRAASYPIVALVFVDGVEDIKVYSNTGCYFNDGREHVEDLVMRDDDSVDFIKCPAGPKGPDGIVFTDAEASGCLRSSRRLLICVSILPRWRLRVMPLTSGVSL